MGTRIRVLSANLRNGGVDPALLAELVAATDADVACLQELTPEQAEAVAGVLPHGRLEPARDHQGMGIALRAPARLGRIALPDRDARIAHVEPDAWPGLAAPLEIIAVHVTAPHVWPCWRSLLWRRRQVRALLRHLDANPDRPRAVLGDLNASPAWPVYRRLARRLTDAPAAVARRRGTRPPRTWGPGPSAPRLLRIDHVLVERVHAEEARALRVPGSDHDAVVVDLHPEAEGWSLSP